MKNKAFRLVTFCQLFFQEVFDCSSPITRSRSDSAVAFSCSALHMTSAGRGTVVGHVVKKQST